MKTYNEIENNHFQYSNYKIIEPMKNFKSFRKNTDTSAAQNFLKKSNNNEVLNRKIAKTFTINDTKKIKPADFQQKKLEITQRAIDNIKKKKGIHFNPDNITDNDIIKEIKNDSLKEFDNDFDLKVIQPDANSGKRKETLKIHRKLEREGKKRQKIMMQY